MENTSTEPEDTVIRSSSVPARGKRYSPAQKKEILAYAEANNVKSAAERFGPREGTIYEWRRAIKRRGHGNGTTASTEAEATAEVEDPKEVRDRRIIAMWRQAPGVWPEPGQEHAQT